MATRNDIYTMTTSFIKDYCTSQSINRS